MGLFESDPYHLPRSIVSRVKFAQIGVPLFIRHRPSLKRSDKSCKESREDPSDQIKSIHINPFYRERIKKRNVFIIDDCTTYGVSFSVAYALLKKAGANSVTGIALGKFGNCLKFYNIEIESDPFNPINNYKFKGTLLSNSENHPSSQNNIIKILSESS